MLAGSRENLKEAAEELVRRANKAGGQDNITVVAFEMTDEPDEQTLERTVEQTQPMPAAEATPEPERRRIWRFLPLLILLLGIAAAAIALWVLVR